MKVKRSKERVKHVGVRRMTAMRRIGQDRSKMKHGDRYPRVNFRIGDDLLERIAKEIEKSGMTTSEIMKQALNEFFAKRE